METQKRIYGSFKQWSENDWSWTKNNGGYDAKRDFFRMHWEVQDKYPDKVFFHVEAPGDEIDPKLNNLKNRMISRILNSEIERNAKKKNLNYIKGRNTSLKMIRKNQSTGVFYILFKNSNNKTEDMIMNVHDKLGGEIEKILTEFIGEIDDLFSK